MTVLKVPSASAGHPSRSACGDAHPARVLVVDDAKDSADTVAELLRLSDCEVWTAGSETESGDAAIPRRV